MEPCCASRCGKHPSGSHKFASSLLPSIAGDPVQSALLNSDSLTGTILPSIPPRCRANLAQRELPILRRTTMPPWRASAELRAVAAGFAARSGATALSAGTGSQPRQLLRQLTRTTSFLTGIWSKHAAQPHPPFHPCRAYTLLRGERLKILAARLCPSLLRNAGKPGQVVKNTGFTVNPRCAAFDPQSSPPESGRWTPGHTSWAPASNPGNALRANPKT